MSQIGARLESLGITLPKPPKVVANYVAWVKSADLVFVSGQLPFHSGKLLKTGRLGQSITVEDGAACARQCAINIIAQLHDACGGDLDRVVRIVKITGFVASDQGFADHPKVLNGASDLLVEVFGASGQHARSAVGVAGLPLDAPVEIEAIVEVV
jgi:enamine deaminase RidA (YjgF/YER057c/UK114 family)